MSEGVFNVATATCCVDCSQCCGYDNGQIVGNSSFGISGRGDYGMTVEDCSGQLLDCTADAGWFSSNSSIASYAGLVNGSAAFSGAGVGSADVTDDDFMNIPIGKGEDCTCGCPQGDVEGMMPIQVQRVITSISSGLGLVGTPKSISIFGQGLTGGNNPGTPSIQLSGTGGMSATITSQSDSQIDINLTSTPGTSAGNAVISVTVNSAASNGEPFLVQIPSRVTFAADPPCVGSTGQGNLNVVMPGTIVDCNGTVKGQGVYGMYRNVALSLLDQNGGPVFDAYQIQETFSGFSTTIPGDAISQPSTINVFAGGTAAVPFPDIHSVALNCNCWTAGENDSVLQNFNVLVSGHQYNLSTAIGIVMGFTSSGQPEVNVTITVL